MSEESNKSFKLIYPGNLGHRRYEAIHYMLEVVRNMPELAGDVDIIVYPTGFLKDMPVERLQSPKCNICSLPNS